MSETPNTNREDIILQFTGVTGASQDFASSFLEAAGWDLNEALNMYLGGGAAQAQAMTGVHGSANEQNNDKAPDEEQIARIQRIMREHNVDEFTAMAIADAQGTPQEAVREPIAATTTRLIDQPTTMLDLDQEMREAREQMRDVVNQGGLSIAFQPNINGNTVASNPTGRNLHDLFSPPRDILFEGSWEQVREMAKDLNKWILVNIQKDSEFLSYNLNRDLWCNEIVKDLINTSFIFFQHEDTDAEAQRYKTYYNPSTYPHVSIIDPFTGEQMIVLELARYQNDPTDMLVGFLEKVNEFLENNTLEGEKIKKMKQKVLQRAREGPVASNSTNQKAAPLVAVPAYSTPLSSIETRPEEVVVATPAPVTTDNDVQTLNLQEIDDEPAKSPDVTTIQIRLFGVKTVKRRFRKVQKVEDVFNFIRHEYPEARTRAFDVICYPQKSLKDRQNSTLLSEKLVNTSLNAVFC